MPGDQFAEAQRRGQHAEHQDAGKGRDAAAPHEGQGVPERAAGKCRKGVGRHRLEYDEARIGEEARALLANPMAFAGEGLVLESTCG